MLRNSSTSAISSFIDKVYPLIPKFLTDHKLDEAHKSEVRRLDDFHKVAGLIDRKTQKSLYPDEFIVDLESFTNKEQLSSIEFYDFLNSIIDDSILKRETAEVLIDTYAEKINTSNNNNEESINIQETLNLSNLDTQVEVVDDIDVKQLMCVTLRLRLLEKFCQTLSRTFPANQGLDVAMSQWGNVVTSLRVEHGVVVSAPALLQRAGLNKVRTSPEGSEAMKQVVNTKQIVAILHACLYGSYSDRIRASSHYFSSCLGEDEEDGEGEAKPMEWSQLEAVLKVVSETSALALRDELVTFVGFNEKTVARSLKEIEKTYSVKEIEEESENKDKDTDNSDKENDRRVGAADAKPKEQVEEAAALKEDSSLTIKDQQTKPMSLPADWSVAFPSDSKEKKFILRHARTWLLHDFDHIQKWRCCFAWADKLVLSPVERNKMDFFGTALLDGQVSVEEVIASQRLHFKELEGFSQHFTAAYKTKRMEAYMGSKGNRETVRTGTVFIIAMALLDAWIIEK